MHVHVAHRQCMHSVITYSCIHVLSMLKTSGSTTGTEAYGKLFNHPALSLCHHQFSKLLVYLPHHNPATKKIP